MKRFYNNRFDFYNALEAAPYPVHKIFKMDQHPDTIFILMEGENPGWRVGQKVSFRNSQTAFTGDIWYIYKNVRSNGEHYFNLYVKPPNYNSIETPKEGGEVIAGTFPETNTQITSSVSNKMVDLSAPATPVVKSSTPVLSVEPTPGMVEPSISQVNSKTTAPSATKLGSGVADPFAPQTVVTDKATEEVQKSSMLPSFINIKNGVIALVAIALGFVLFKNR